MVGSMFDAFLGVETGALRVHFAGFFPVTRKDVGRFVRFAVDMLRDDSASVEAPENGDAACSRVLVEHFEVDSLVRAGFPVDLIT